MSVVRIGQGRPPAGKRQGQRLGASDFEQLRRNQKRTMILTPQVYQRRVPMHLSANWFKYITKNQLRFFGHQWREGDQKYEIAETDLTLSGAVVYVYLEHERSGTTAIWDKAASDPLPTSSHARRRLFKFVAVAGIYCLSAWFHFETYLDVPLR
jgi:hypothetical protein